MSLHTAQAEAARRKGAFSLLEETPIGEGSMFCLRSYDDELFDRALGSVTGSSPSKAAATAVVSTLEDKVRAGYRLSMATQDLLDLAKQVLAG